MSNNGSGFVVKAVGDVFVDRVDSTNPFEYLQGALADGDLVFGNCEGVYSKRINRAPSSGVPLVSDPINMNILSKAGFTTMSLANNHSLDCGYEAFLQTYEGLKDLGITPIGGGPTQEDSHCAAISKKNGLTVATLAYTSVFPHGYEARGNVPGMAVLRAHNVFVPWELNEWNPGLLPKVFTKPVEQDYDHMREDIEKAKENADIVIVSVHWGDFTRPYVLTDHEKRTAHMAIDLGADIVLGHHHHLIRSVEIYKNKPIFYGLGHFVFDLPNLEDRLVKSGYLVAAKPEQQSQVDQRFGEYKIWPREETPLLPFHSDARMTIIADVSFSVKGEIERIAAIPCWIDSNNCPRLIFSDEHEKADEIKKYIELNCMKENIKTRINVCNHEPYFKFIFE